MTSDIPMALNSKISVEADRFSDQFGPTRTRRVLVVGGAGYIGAPVTQYLLGQGYKVRCLDRLIYDNASTITGFLSHPDYEFALGDMGHNETMDQALEDVTDVVILAGLVGDPITKKFPDAAHEINDLAVSACIDRLAGRGLNKVIFISTCSNYGMIADDAMADENFELSPLSLYAKSKVAAETKILGLKGKVDYHPTVLRFATAFGFAPRMRFDLTVNEFTRELHEDNELLVYDAHTWRPYCHVFDFARLIDRVLAFPIADVSFEVFNAGGDKNNHTKQSIVDLVCQRLPERNVAYKEHSTDPRNYKVNFEKVRTKLFFEPAMSVQDGIDEIIWALSSRLTSDISERKNFYGNYEILG
ncbi:MAG: NAD-dependent epimerase/dehydratase family protein [Hyphomicrobiaceae bacterium]